MKKTLLECMALLFLVASFNAGCAKKAVVAPKGTYKTTTQPTGGSTTNSDGQNSHNGCGGGDHSNGGGSGS